MNLAIENIVFFLAVANAMIIGYIKKACINKGNLPRGIVWVAKIQLRKFTFHLPGVWVGN